MQREKLAERGGGTGRSPTAAGGESRRSLLCSGGAGTGCARFCGPGKCGGGAGGSRCGGRAAACGGQVQGVGAWWGLRRAGAGGGGGGRGPPPGARGGGCPRPPGGGAGLQPSPPPGGAGWAPPPSAYMAALRSGGGARSALVPCDAAACARCPAAGEVCMRSIRMGLGAKSTGNGKSVRTRVKRKRSARVSSRIKSAK